MKKKTYKVALQFVEYEVGGIKAKNKKKRWKKRGKNMRTACGTALSMIGSITRKAIIF
jgi:hypothetical protein